jgi:hypothetical protein
MAQIILDSNNNLIQGDFDNATLNNRTKLQTTTTNATTNVYVAPNGSATSAGVSVANNSSLTNASKIVMATNGATDTQIISGINGTGSYLPLSFYTNNTLGMQLSTAGNLTVTGSVTATGGFVQGATAAPAFSAYRGSNQSVTAATWTKIQINTEEFDTNSNYDNSTNYRFTPTVAGYYQVNGCLTLNSSTQAAITIYKNGVAFKGGNNIPPNGVTVIVSALIYMNGTTDYIELYGYSGITNIFDPGAVVTYFQAFLARSA